MKVKTCHIWFGFALVALAGTVFSFVNFWAAANLGYDTSPRGKTILSGWCYASIGLCLSLLVFLVLAVRSTRRRSLDLGTER